jgi:hypothetical protein
MFGGWEGNDPRKKISNKVSIQIINSVEPGASLYGLAPCFDSPVLPFRRAKKKRRRKAPSSVVKYFMRPSRVQVVQVCTISRPHGFACLRPLLRVYTTNVPRWLQ